MKESKTLGSGSPPGLKLHKTKRRRANQANLSLFIGRPVDHDKEHESHFSSSSSSSCCSSSGSHASAGTEIRGDTDRQAIDGQRSEQKAGQGTVTADGDSSSGISVSCDSGSSPGSATVLSPRGTPATPDQIGFPYRKADGTTGVIPLDQILLGTFSLPEVPPRPRVKTPVKSPAGPPLLSPLVSPYRPDKVTKGTVSASSSDLSLPDSQPPTPDTPIPTPTSHLSPLRGKQRTVAPPSSLALFPSAGKRGNSKREGSMSHRKNYRSPTGGYPLTSPEGSDWTQPSPSSVSLTTPDDRGFPGMGILPLGHPSLSQAVPLRMPPGTGTTVSAKPRPVSDPVMSSMKQAFEDVRLSGRMTATLPREGAGYLGYSVSPMLGDRGPVTLGLTQPHGVTLNSLSPTAAKTETETVVTGDSKSQLTTKVAAESLSCSGKPRVGVLDGGNGTEMEDSNNPHRDKPPLTVTSHAGVTVIVSSSSPTQADYTPSRDRDQTTAIQVDSKFGIDKPEDSNNNLTPTTDSGLNVMASGGGLEVQTPEEEFRANKFGLLRHSQLPPKKRRYGPIEDDNLLQPGSSRAKTSRSEPNTPGCISPGTPVAALAGLHLESPVGLPSPHTSTNSKHKSWPLAVTAEIAVSADSVARSVSQSTMDVTCSPAPDSHVSTVATSWTTSTGERVHSADSKVSPFNPAATQPDPESHSASSTSPQAETRTLTSSKYW